MAIHATRMSTENELLESMAFQGLPPSNTSDMFRIRVMKSPVRLVVGRSFAVRSRRPRSWRILLTAPVSLWSQDNLGLSGGESGDWCHNGNKRHLSLCYVTFHDEVHPGALAPGEPRMARIGRDTWQEDPPVEASR